MGGKGKILMYRYGVVPGLCRSASGTTYCSKELEEGIFYCSHENIFKSNRRHRSPQDLLWKFIIPTSEKNTVMKKLEAKKINTSTLFDSKNVPDESNFLQDLFTELDNEIT